MEQSTAKFAPQLRALVALVARDGHMTRAAGDLAIPQSSMSRRISALQSALSVPLLIHDGRSVRLTPAARELAARVRGPLAEVDQALAELGSDADPDRGTVRFGFPLTMGSGRIPDLLAQFHQHHPGIRVQLKQAHGSELNADLLSGALDLAVVIPAPAEGNHQIIGVQPVFAVLPESHHLATAAQLSLDALEGEVFIANPTTYNLRELTETWCRDAGYEPDITIEVTEFATIRELVVRNLGIALLPHDDRIPPGIVEVPLEGDHHTRSIALAWTTTTQAPPTRRLHKYLQDRYVKDPS